jgi:hypothetical protein
VFQGAPLRRQGRGHMQEHNSRRAYSIDRMALCMIGEETEQQAILFNSFNADGSMFLSLPEYYDR